MDEDFQFTNDFSFEDDEVEKQFTDSFLHLNLPATYSASTNQQISASSFSTTVDPVVLFSILDHHLRRADNQTRVVGALLGIRSSDDLQEVEVRSCFPLALLDSGELDFEYFKSMYQLHMRVNPKETIVGWYSTGTITSIDEQSVAIHSFFSRDKILRPVHLLVDTEMTNQSLGIKAFVSNPIALPSAKEHGSLFVQVPCDFKYFDAERAGLDVIATARDSPSHSAGLLSDMDNLEQSIVKVRDMIDRVLTYVNDVVDGNIKSNNAIGRYLMDTVSCIPKLDAREFETMFNKHLHDLLMVVYLANLTRTQLAIAERLNNMSGDV